MSRWTHIAAVVDYDSLIEDKNIKSIIEEKLKNAPKITGGEEDAQIYVVLLNDHNVWSSIEGDFQTRVAITIVGDLRHKSGYLTRKEWKEFLKYVSNMEGSIRNYTCKIVDEYEEYRKKIV